MARAVLAFPLALILVVGLPHAASADMDCGDFSSHAEAQAYFERNGGGAFNNADLLDEDGDGLACEWGPYESHPSGSTYQREYPASDYQYEPPYAPCADSDPTTYCERDSIGYWLPKVLRWLLIGGGVLLAVAAVPSVIEFLKHMWMARDM